MPLFRIEVKDKNESTDPGADGPAADARADESKSADPTGHQSGLDEEAAHPSPDRRSRSAAETGSRTLPALVAGAFFGLVLVAGLSFYLVSQGQQGPEGSDTEAPMQTTAAMTPGAGGSTGDLAGAAGTDPAMGSVSAMEDPLVDNRTGPTVLNPDYRLEDVIATVNGRPIAMRDLERAVRVARVLGDLTGDPVPPVDNPQIRQFQVQMLKRLVDLELMAQGADRADVLVPGGEVDVAVEAFLAESGKTRADLQAEMDEHGVSQEELNQWFRRARTANFFVTQHLMAGEEGVPHAQAAQQWLDNQWDTQTIDITFYDPETLDLPATESAP